MGGLNAYQKASLKGGNENIGKGYCGKWVAPYLLNVWNEQKALSHCAVCGKPGSYIKPSHFRLLDVGALNGDTYTRYTWIQCESIDLHPQHQHVKKQDFFDRPVPPRCSSRCLQDSGQVFDCVSGR
jgi:25S rRNA (adenine2142-N1)-methyltransferase